MNSNTRLEAIKNFTDSCQEPSYVDYLKLNAEQIEDIIPYFEKVKNLTDETAIEVITIMRRSIETANRSESRGDWIRCCVGIAKYLLSGKLDDISDKPIAAGVIVRLSGWVNTGASMYQEFKPAARRISMNIWGEYIRYLKIKEWYSGLHEFTFSYGSLWDFAKEFQTEETEIRTFSSRVLNFICDRNYYKIEISAVDYKYIGDYYARDHDILNRWAVSSKKVDEIAQRIIIESNDLQRFLTQQKFNPNQMYKPDAERRINWFRRWKVKS